MQVRIDWKRAHEVFSQLLAALRERLPPYNKAVDRLPQRFLPQNLPRGSAEHARFLFVVTLYMRGGIKSRPVVQELARLYNDHPEFFAGPLNGDAEDRLRSLIRTTIETRGLPADLDKAEKRKVRIAYEAGVMAHAWIEGLRKIDRFWGGDPRNLFGPSPHYALLFRRLICGSRKRHRFDPNRRTGFIGFQKKLASMLAYYFVEAGLVERFLFPAPADFHVMRVLAITKVITVPGTTFGDDLLRPFGFDDYARTVTYQYCRRYGVDSCELAEALWLLSENFCVFNPGNATSKGEYEARQTELKPKPFAWTGRRIARYEKTCGSCPVKRLCRFNVPSAEYYVRGRLVIRGPRLVSPQTHLFDSSS